MERKAVAVFTKDADERQRTIIGIGAVHGNIDDGGDRSHPGAFARAVRDPSRVKFLWQHDSTQPPIAKVTRVREIGRAELPAMVLNKAPEATGGLEVTRQYLTHATAEAAYQGVLSGALSEMSYAYAVLRYDYSAKAGKRVRELRELDLLEASDVCWGMNPATVANLAAKRRAAVVAAQTGSRRADPMEILKLEVAMLRNQFRYGGKEGRTLSGVNRERLLSYEAALTALLKDIKELLAATAPKRADPATIRELEAMHEKMMRAYIRDAVASLDHTHGGRR